MSRNGILPGEDISDEMITATFSTSSGYNCKCVDLLPDFAVDLNVVKEVSASSD